MSLNSRINQLQSLELAIDIPRKGDKKIKSQATVSIGDNHKVSHKTSSLEEFVDAMYTPDSYPINTEKYNPNNTIQDNNSYRSFVRSSELFRDLPLDT